MMHAVSASDWVLLCSGGPLKSDALLLNIWDKIGMVDIYYIVYDDTVERCITIKHRTTKFFD